MIGKLFKFLGTAICLLVVGMLAFRIFSLNHYPAFAEGVIPTSALSKSYSEKTLSGTTWEPPAEFDAIGKFFIHQPIYFENEKTLIITIRYNDSLLKDLKFDGSGETLPLFPSLYADNTKRILPLKYEYGHTYGVYSYRRYVFENVDLSVYDHLYLDIHTENDYELTPYTTLEVYNKTVKISNYKFTLADKKDLSK